MTKQLLYYEHAVPVSAQRHRDWALEVLTDYEFASHSNSIPLAAAEFPAAAGDYAIVFTGSEEAVQPAVILGLKPDENLYLDEQGKWDAGYIPAFVRRYPFVFSKSEDGSKFVLCIDEEYSGWNQEGHGKPLFDSNGEGAAFLNRMFRFVTDYQRQFDATLAFCRKLKELDLLESMTARFNLPSGDKAALTGFMAIDRDKLKALPGDKLVELSRTGELELIYIHLQSLRNLSKMLARVTGDEAGGEFGKEMADLAPEGPWH
jgi:hypothetical protein